MYVFVHTPHFMRQIYALFSAATNIIGNRQMLINKSFFEELKKLIEGDRERFS